MVEEESYVYKMGMFDIKSNTKYIYTFTYEEY